MTEQRAGLPIAGELSVEESAIALAVWRLADTAVSCSEARLIPMLGGASLTGIGEQVGAFMRSIRVALHSTADAAGAASRRLSELSEAAEQLDAYLSGRLGAGAGSRLAADNGF